MGKLPAAPDVYEWLRSRDLAKGRRKEIPIVVVLSPFLLPCRRADGFMDSPFPCFSVSAFNNKKARVSFLFTRIFLVQRLNLLKIYYMLTTATETDDTSSIRIIRNEQIFRGLFCSFCGQVNTTSCCVVDSGARQQFGQILRIYSVYVYRV